MAKYSHVRRGGVGAPVGFAVFKTVEGVLVHSLVGSTPIRLCLIQGEFLGIPGVLTAITITPQQGPSGTSITISGTGFVPAEQVTIEWVDPTTNRGTVLTTLTIPSSTFSFNATVTAPTNLTPGTTYYIEVPNTYTGDTVKAAFIAQ